MSQIFLKGIEKPSGRTVEVSGTPPLSFVRMFGPATSTPIAADQWTSIVLDPAGEPWQQFGEPTWEAIMPGDPDYDEFGAGVRCIQEGLFSFTGSIIYNAIHGTGDRGIDIREVKGPREGLWDLVLGIPMPKVVDAPLLVSGESYQSVGNIVQLRGYSTVATSTTENPRSEWLSIALISPSE